MLKDKPFPKLQLCYIRALVFQPIVILLLLTESCRGQSQEDGPAQTIVTLVGRDVTLPCHLNPALDAVSHSLEWGRPDLDPRFIHVWHQGQNILINQNPSYKGRTSVSKEKLKLGDLSLELYDVRHSDNGKYRCYFPSRNKESTVELVVGSVSSPFMAEMYLNSSRVVLRCESGGWYPEPEVLWLDAEGNLLSAGPTETVRGPDDLYTVSSRVTVEKRHSNSFTCRVQQKDTNQTRETQIQISADCFEAPSFSAARTIIIVVVVLIFISAAAFVVWKWRRNQTKETGQRESQQLMAENKEMEDLREKNATLEESLKKKEEEQEKLEQAVKTMMEKQKEDLQEQRRRIKQQKEEMDENIRDIENKVQSVEKMQESERYVKMKEIVLTAKNHIRDRRRGEEELDIFTSDIMNKTQSLLNELKIEKKKINEEKKNQTSDSEQSCIRKDTDH